MIESFKDFFTLEMIYQVTNIGVIPLWLLIIFVPRSKITQGLVNNLFIPLIMAFTYSYLALEQLSPSDALSYNTEKDPLDFLENFKLYLGLDQLMLLMDKSLFVLIFWIHFLTISLFLGVWIANDAIKYNIHKYIVFFPLMLTYFSGPVGLFLYLIFLIYLLLLK